MKVPAMLFSLVALCFLAGISCAAERARVTLPQTRPLTAACVLDAARAGGLPAAALFGILATEGGKTGEALRNTNGTWDMGPFQVNKVHVATLAAMGIAPEAVLQDGCVNAYAAAWLLRREYLRTGDIWQAIGAYHSRTPHHRDAYMARVRANLEKLHHRGIAMLPSLQEARP